MPAGSQGWADGGGRTPQPPAVPQRGGCGVLPPPPTPRPAPRRHRRARPRPAEPLTAPATAGRPGGDGEHRAGPAWRGRALRSGGSGGGGPRLSAEGGGSGGPWGRRRRGASGALPCPPAAPRRPSEAPGGYGGRGGGGTQVSPSPGGRGVPAGMLWGSAAGKTRRSCSPPGVLSVRGSYLASPGDALPRAR